MTEPRSAGDPANQPPPFEDIDLFTSDTVLHEAVLREGGGRAATELKAIGVVAGSAESIERARAANESPPRLRTHDAQGRRIDRVDFHPAYHMLMEQSMHQGLHCSVWDHLARPGSEPRAGANVIRAAHLYMAAQMEAGHCCPLTMTNAAQAALAKEPSLSRDWLPKLRSRAYEPALAPVGHKRSVTIGMGLTERQGGSDVRANTTRAEPTGRRGSGSEYVLTGHKWFLSAPMSDAFLVTAQAEGGLSTFLLPRVLEDGSCNPLHIVRLKDKLGNRSNATAEVELAGCLAWLVGEEGAGISAIIDTIALTRLDCAVASAGLMRSALAHAVHFAEHRLVRGRQLAGEPVMAQVLSDLALDVEAATALVFRLARALDRSADARAAAWCRLMTPVTKYWVCKLAPAVVAEAMECLGGSGYVEEQPLARIYREVPVNSIWEGSGTVMALDVLRVLQREPEAAGLVMEELEAAAACHPQLRAAHSRIEAMLQEPRLLDARARSLAESLATLAAGSILAAHAPAAVAEAFIATRLEGVSRQSYGQGLEHADVGAIIRRASPDET